LSTTDLRLVVLSNPNINVNVPILDFVAEVQKDSTYSVVLLPFST
jgi:hypothetical protein